MWQHCICSKKNKGGDVSPYKSRFKTLVLFKKNTTFNYKIFIYLLKNVAKNIADCICYMYILYYMYI